MLGLVLLGAAIACDSSSEPAPTPSATTSPTATPRPAHSPAPGLPYKGDWVLVSGTTPKGPIPIYEDFLITLALRERRASGRSTCNSYGGRFRIDGTTFSPGTFGANQAGCAKRALERPETLYLSSLVSTREVYADDTTLRLTGPDVELVFERVPHIDLGALVDRTWVSGDHTLLLSSDRTFRVTYGCDVVVGTWTELVGRIYMPETRTAKDCPARGIDDVPVDVTSGDFAVVVDGHRLTITNAGRSLVYRARP